MKYLNKDHSGVPPSRDLTLIRCDRDRSRDTVDVRGMHEDTKPEVQGIDSVLT